MTSSSSTSVYTRLADDVPPVSSSADSSSLPPPLSLDAIQIGSAPIGNCEYILPALYKGERVVVKVLEQSHTLEDPTQEIRILHRLCGASILRFYGWFRHPQLGLCTCCEMAQQSSLYDLIRGNVHHTERQLSWAFRSRVARAIAVALREIHARGIIHRDLKSGNVFIVEASDGTVQPKLSDFGLAITCEKACAKQPADKPLPRGKIVGTLRWAPPEAHYDAWGLASDVWSFGMVLWELCQSNHKNEPYHTYQSDEALIAAIRRGETPAIPVGCPEIWQGLIERCWQRNPTKRPTIQDICRVLESSAFDNNSPQPSSSSVIVCGQKNVRDDLAAAAKPQADTSVAFGLVQGASEQDRMLGAILGRCFEPDPLGSHNRHRFWNTGTSLHILLHIACYHTQPDVLEKVCVLLGCCAQEAFGAYQQSAPRKHDFLRQLAHTLETIVAELLGRKRLVTTAMFHALSAYCSVTPFRDRFVQMRVLGQPLLAHVVNAMRSIISGECQRAVCQLLMQFTSQQLAYVQSIDSALTYALHNNHFWTSTLVISDILHVLLHIGRSGRPLTCHMASLNESLQQIFAVNPVVRPHILRVRQTFGLPDPDAVCCCNVQ